MWIASRIAGVQTLPSKTRRLAVLESLPELVDLLECAHDIVHICLCTEQEPLFNSLMEHYHYLAYEQPVGEHLKYLAWAQGRPIACLAWSSAPRHLGSRDRYIGWSAEARWRNIRFIAYNTRFLILPWVRVPHLASHILGKMTSVLSDDWERIYGHPVYFAETFIDPGRFRGSCYRAANWISVGQTQGRGRMDRTHQAQGSCKNILLYPLESHWRQDLCHLPAPQACHASTGEVP